MTSDQRTRSAERSGDRVAWLTERKRRGDRAPWDCSHCHHGCGGYWREGEGYPLNPDGSVPWRECPDCQGTGRAGFTEALELAAYAGDPAARQVRDWCEDAAGMVDGRDLADFVDGLPAPGALERAALAACEVWLAHEPECRHQWRRAACRRCLSWVAYRAARAHIEAPSVGDTFPWTDGPVGSLCTGLAAVPRNNAFLVDAINEAARLSDPAAVRAGICAALIAWSLG